MTGQGRLRQIAPDVFHIPLAPRNGINAFLLGDALVDTGIRQSAGTLRKVADEHGVRAIALTHAHGDHAGSAKKLHEDLRLPVWVGAADREATERGKAVKKDPFNKPVLSTVAALMGDFPGVPVQRVLTEGDELTAGFTVLETPGHSPGHVSFWRERDRVLICGDVFFNMHLLTTIPGLRQPPGPFTFDPRRNRRSERRIAELEPEIAGFGHGPVLTQRTAARIANCVAGLRD